MIAGPYNKEHQSKVLIAAPTCKTFQQQFDFLNGLEATDKSTANLGNNAPTTQTVDSTHAVMRSQYQRKKDGNQAEASDIRE